MSNAYANDAVRKQLEAQVRDVEFNLRQVLSGTHLVASHIRLEVALSSGDMIRAESGIIRESWKAQSVAEPTLATAPKVDEEPVTKEPNRKEEAEW